MKSVFCRVLVWLCVVASAAAQGQTLTTALPDNGAGGVFMNLLPADGPLTLTGFDVPLDAGAPQGTTVTVQVWVRAGDYAGFTDSSAGWTLSQTVSGVHQGAAWTPFALSNPLTLDGGAVTAIHLHSTTAGAGLRFTGSDAQTPKTAWANSDLSLSSDTARTGAEAFGGTEEVPRAFSGTLHYTRALPTQEANNGSGGVFLDLQATGRPLLVTGFDLYLDGGPGVASSIQVWTREGSYVGATDSDAGWTLSQTIVVASAFDLPTRVNLRAPIRVMPARTTSARLSTSRCCGGGSSQRRSTCCAAMPAWRARSTDSVIGTRLRTKLGSSRFRRSSCSDAALSDMATSCPSWRTTSGQARGPSIPGAAWPLMCAPPGSAASPGARRRAPCLGVNQFNAMACLSFYLSRPAAAVLAFFLEGYRRLNSHRLT